MQSTWLSSCWGVAIIVCGGNAASALEARDFARHPEISEVVISPDGSNLAVTVVNEQRRDLAVIRLADLEVIASVSPGAGEHVYDICWASDNRILVALASSGRYRAEPVPTGELMAIDRDGRNGRYLFGARGTHSDGEYLSDTTRRARFASIVTPMRDDSTYALIQSWSYFASPDTRYALIERLDLQNGRSFWATQAPIVGPVDVVADVAGTVHYVQGKTPVPGVLQTFLRDPATDAWERLSSTDPLADFSPLAVSNDGQTGYLKVREGHDRFCLERQNLGTGMRERLVCHPQADLSDVIIAPGSGHVVAAVFDPGRPEIHWLPTPDPEAEMLRTVWGKFPGANVRMTSHSRDGKRWVLRVDSDVNPGAFYLFDRATAELRFLLDRRPALAAEPMPARALLRWKAADDREIVGYLTRPRHADPGKPPLVVLLHGGPFDVRDTWKWQPEAAFLATKGYLVLQPQFRGSSGFGRAFRDAGQQKLGTDMVEDINRGVDFLIDSGVADPDRIAVMGHSAGAQLALMSVVRAPGRYRAAIGISGGYDLLQQRRELWAQGDRDALAFFDRFIGDEKDLLRDHSPRYHAAEISVPVFLAHGQRDRTLPIRQSEQMLKSLRRAGAEASLLSFTEEVHFLFDEDNRTQLYERVLAFLDHHLGPHTR